jgi:exodeoxyribonuclease V alpha subunit
LHPFRFVGTANSDLALRMEEVYPTDAAKYCFTVGTHMWLSRYHGSVAVTGNSGKSTVLNAVVKIMQHKGIDMEQCALSGRASSNLTDITGLVGKTIHRLLGYIPDSGRFAHNEANQLGVGVYVIDEASMVGGDLFLSLLQAIPTGSIVVMVGDLAQLDPIGGSAVFKDCIVSRYIPVSELRELHRQARESGIVSAALTVSYGRQLVKNSFVGEEVLGEKQDFRLIGMSDRESIPFAVVTEYQRLLNSGVDPHEIQVLAPTRSRGGLSCYSLNSALQAIANPSVLGEGMSVEYVENQTVFRVVYHMGDRVIVTSNNYHAKTANGEECAVFNGNIGYIVAIASDHVIIRLTEQGDVVFYAKEMMGIMLAYAATVHKFQGTGIGYVIFALDMGSFKLLSKELVYTAITRAKKYCCVIAQVSALNLASRTNSIADKRTWLLDDLRDLSLQQVKDKLASK